MGYALLVLATGSGGLYYAYFSAFLVAVAGAGRVLATKVLREGVPALLIAAGITATVAVNVGLDRGVPGSQRAQSGSCRPSRSRQRNVRLALDAARACRIGMHRVGKLRNLAERYSTQSLMVNENATASLGLVGGPDFVILAFVALRRFAVLAEGPSTMSFLALVALACFLLATMGGAGALFAYLVIPSIRGYNRISVFIGFVSAGRVSAGGAERIRAYPAAGDGMGCRRGSRRDRARGCRGIKRLANFPSGWIPRLPATAPS